MGTDGGLTYQQAPNRLNDQPVSSPLAGGPAGSHLDLQTDGNLVLYGPGGAVELNFDTAGSGAVRLRIQDDGNLVLYGAAYEVIINFAYPDIGFLAPGQVLLPGESQRSVDGTATLTMQADGNLVLTRGSTVVFSTGTYGNPDAAAIQQLDGNFAVYSNASPPVALFATGTSNSAGDATELDLFGDELKVLVALGDGVESLYSTAWTSDTVTAGQTLFAGDRRTSRAGACTLILQTDGNLVDYCGGRVAFNARTSGITFAVMQTDGNFVVVEVRLDDQALAVAFQTRSSGHAGARLTVQDDRNLVVYTPQDRPVFRIR